MIISIYSISIWITAVFIIGLDIILILGSKKFSSKVFTLLTFITALWVTSQGFFIATTSEEFANFLIRFQYILGIMISVGFYHFSYIYPTERSVSRKALVYSSSVILFFTFLYIFTNLSIVGVTEIGGTGRWKWILGPLDFLYEITFCYLWFLCLRRLYNSFVAERGKLRVSIRNVLLALFLGIIPPTAMDIILPSFGYYDLNWLGPITSVIWIGIIAYSISKHHLFNTKIIAIEIVTFGLWAIILIRTLFAQNIHEVLVECTLLLVTVVFGILLIRSVLFEISQREKIEGLATDLKKAYSHLRDLNDHLEQKVAEQTVEIRKSYEVEKRARIELEKLNKAKDEFITKTQHHLRTPLTAIEWETDALLEEPGSGRDRFFQGLNRIQEASKKLHVIIENFIRITQS